MRCYFMTIFSAAIVTAANAQSPSTADLLGTWVCPTDTCLTVCSSLDLAGQERLREFRAKTVKMFVYAKQGNRIMLDLDGRVVLLGESDSCEPGGDTTVTYSRPPQLPGYKFKPVNKPCHGVVGRPC